MLGCIDRLYARQVISYWIFLIALPLSLLSSYFLLVSLASESKALLYEASSNPKIIEAYGRIANNQIMNDGSISWIQSGLWYMSISDNDTDNSKNAYFYADFKMVRPDGSSLHKHFIKDFKSTNVGIEEGKVKVNGVADIYSGDYLEYKEIPITIDLKNNTVLGLTIDMDRTHKHFASSNANEILGVLIESRNLDKFPS
jgi:hypothetical protein